MKSRLSAEFVALFSHLPPDVQRTARKNYRLWRQNPAHPSLRYKPMDSRPGVWSIRIGLQWRALGLIDGDVITWFWIGSHADYDAIVS